MEENKKELIEYFIKDNQSGYKTREKYVKKHIIGLAGKINEYNNKFFDIDFPFTQKLYNYLYDITEIPKCDNCGKSIKWRGVFTEGYLKNCSKECKNRSKLRVERTKITNIEKYGVDSVLKYDKFKAKRWETMNKKIVEKFKKHGYNIIETNKTTLKIIHPDGHIFEGNRKLFSNRLNDGFEISTKLLPLKSIRSTYELEIQFFLNSLNIKYVIGSRKILNRKEIDIYIEPNKLGVEFDGLYWHSNLFVTNNYHLNKTEECEKLGIELIHIFEDEWINKKEIIKSMIKIKLGIYDNIFNINNCFLNEITNKTCVDFLNVNDIQERIDSNVSLGLFYNNDLITILLINNKLSGEYEIRFCNKLNCKIIDSERKLFEYFIKKYNPKNVITFVDRRYSQGDLYKELGFKFIENIKPNCWEVQKNHISRERRYNFRNKLLNENIIENFGLKIYDCGYIKFELSFIF